MKSKIESLIPKELLEKARVELEELKETIKEAEEHNRGITRLNREDKQRTRKTPMNNLPAIRAQDCKEFRLLSLTAGRSWFCSLFAIKYPGYVIPFAGWGYYAVADGHFEIPPTDCSAWEN